MAHALILILISFTFLKLYSIAKHVTHLIRFTVRGNVATTLVQIIIQNKIMKPLVETWIHTKTNIHIII